jgi:two-component system, NarL family, sensor kinase
MTLKRYVIHTSVLLLIVFCLGDKTFANSQQNDTYSQELTELSKEEQFRALSRLSIDNWKIAPESSIIYGLESLTIAEGLNNKRFQAEALNNIGVAHSYASSFGEALEYFFKALVLREEIGDENLIATTLNNIGNVYHLSGDNEQAITYYKKSLEIKEASERKQQVTSTLINLASLYNSKGDHQEAINYINRAISYLEAEADSSGLSTAWNNLARIYMHMGDLDESLKLNKKALEISEKIGRQWDIAYISNSVAEIYLMKKQLDQALFFIERGKKAADQIQNRDIILYNYRLMTIFYSHMGESEKFMEAFRNYDQLKDSIFSERNSRAIAEMQVIYKTEQREKENAIQKLQIARERSLRNSFIFITIIVVILVGVLYRRYRIKQNLNIKLENQVQRRTADLIKSHEQINRLNQDLLSNTIETEERERRRFSEDLHDGLGPLLSTIKIHLELIENRKGNEEEQYELLLAAEGLINDAIQSTKDIANNLTPNILSDFGLKEALEGYVQKIKTMGSILVDLETELPASRYPAHIELALYRICLELINNSIKHARADNIRIFLTGNGDEVKLTFNDDGMGFNPEEKLSTGVKGLGLSNIISRIKSVNGNYTIKSAPGKGFEMQLSIVLKNSTEVESSIQKITEQ